LLGEFGSNGETKKMRGESGWVRQSVTDFSMNDRKKKKKKTGIFKQTERTEKQEVTVVGGGIPLRPPAKSIGKEVSGNTRLKVGGTPGKLLGKR